MSIIKAIRAQLGLSATPANNFTLEASADNGTMKLARGNAGATTQDILTVDPSGEVSLPSNTLNRLVSASGSAPVIGCRAWCRFNGTLTGTNSPLKGSNVTSVTRNSLGNYTINFSTPMQTVNYATLGSCLRSPGNDSLVVPENQLVNSVTVNCITGAGTESDMLAVSVTIFE